jgi:hypothetical protein
MIHTCDPYCYDVSVGDELKGDGVLTASDLGGISLHFVGTGTGIRAYVPGGRYSSSLMDWQGKEAYRIQNDGESEAASYRRREEMFARHTCTTLPNAIIGPVYEYGRQYGKLTPKYRGARMLTRSLGTFPGVKGVLTWSLEARGVPY